MRFSGAPPKIPPIRILKAWFPLQSGHAAVLSLLGVRNSHAVFDCANTFLTGRIEGPQACGFPAPSFFVKPARSSTVRYQHEAHRRAFLAARQPLGRGWPAPLAELRVLPRRQRILRLTPLAAVIIVLQQEKDHGQHENKSGMAVQSGGL